MRPLPHQHHLSREKEPSPGSRRPAIKPSPPFLDPLGIKDVDLAGDTDDLPKKTFPT